MKAKISTALFMMCDTEKVKPTLIKTGRNGMYPKMELVYRNYFVDEAPNKLHKVKANCDMLMLECFRDSFYIQNN